MVERLKRCGAHGRLAGMVAVGVALLVFREPLMFSMELWMACRNDYPRATSVNALLEDKERREDVLRALWATGRVPHREMAVSFLKAKAMMEPELERGLEPLFDVTGEAAAMIVLDGQGRLVRRLSSQRSNAELVALLRHLFPLDKTDPTGNKPG